MSSSKARHLALIPRHFQSAKSGHSQSALTAAFDQPNHRNCCQRDSCKLSLDGVLFRYPTAARAP